MSRSAVGEEQKTLVDLCDQVAASDDPVIFDHHGKKLAIVPAEDVELLEEFEQQVDLEAAREAMEEPGENITLEKLAKELGL